MRSRPAAAAPSVLVAVALAAACGGGSPPPALGSSGGVDAGDGSSSLISDAGPIIQNCGVGPDGGVCACADEPLVVDPPTLYFVLDRSGSMNDMGKWSTVRAVLGQLTVGLGDRARFAAAVFPDPTLENCAPGRQIFPTLRGQPLPPVQGDGAFGSAGPIDLDFASSLGMIDAEGGTPTAATLQALLPLVKGFGGKTYVVFATDGGPNCDASAACTAALCTLNIESDNGCTPTGPDCCTSTPDSCLDAQPSIDAVTAFAAAGIPVYVIGLPGNPGSDLYASLLDALATAGGTARGSEPQYYAVSTYDQAALRAAMSQIAAKVAGSCTLTLDNAPPVPTEVNVFLDGNAIPQPGANGWTLSGKTVTIHGSSCQAILDGSVIDVRVVAGCPTKIH